MGTVEKRDKHKKRRFVSPEEKLERELKDCMHCRFFWGHNNRCANGTCCKPSKKKEQKLPTECVGCPYYQGKSYGSRRNSNFRDTQVDIKDNSWSVEAGLRTCQNNSSSIRYGGKDISFIRKNGHILRGGERMQVKGLFLNYKKNRRLMQYFFKIRELV